MTTTTTTTTPFTEQLSETWLLEKTYHAQLRDGSMLSVPDLSEAMRQLTDFDVSPSLLSGKSHLAEKAPLKESANFEVPLPTWREVSAEEASTNYQQGTPILLYGEHVWEHPRGVRQIWGPNKNARRIFYGNAVTQPEARSGIRYAVCYLDPRQGIFSNTTWKAWFTSDVSDLFAGRADSTIIFLAPWVQFPYTTHYTVIASDGRVHEYAGRAQARQGFQTLLPLEVSEGSLAVFPRFYYYHEVTCPGGVYRIPFFAS